MLFAECGSLDRSAAHTCTDVQWTVHSSYCRESYTPQTCGPSLRPIGNIGINSVLNIQT